MEQLNQLGGRLLGKKSVAVILGLLGLCCPSSLWAEKLDTTFVLDIDMTIDTTPCYYAKYENGVITDYGRYESSSNFNSTDYFRINTGYVTNEKGETLETLIYACDRVTRQWRKIEYMGKLFFDGNGMVRQMGSDYQSSCYEYPMGSGDMYCSGYGEYYRFYDGYVVEYFKRKYDAAPRHTNESYGVEAKYDDSGNIIEYSTNNISSIQENSTFTNKYDDNGNNVFVEKRGAVDDPRGERMYDFIIGATKEYDSHNRLVKIVNEEVYFPSFTNSTTSSVIYAYCQPSPSSSSSPFLIITKDGCVNEDAGLDKHEYDFTDSYFYSDLIIIGEDLKKTYDAGSSVLTIQALDTIYTIACKKPMPYLNTILIDGVPLDSFSFDKFEYDCSSDYVFGQISYKAQDGTTVNRMYNTETRTLTLTVCGTDYAYDSTNMRAYSILCKEPESYLTSVDINGIPVDGFSYDKFQYDLSDISFDDTSFSWQVSAGATMTKDYNERDAVLNILVRGCDYLYSIKDSIIYNQHKYTFTFKKPTYMSSLSFGGSKVDTFSADKYIYDFSDFYFQKFTEVKEGMYLAPTADDNANRNNYFVQWSYSYGVVGKSYDPLTGNVSVQITDKDNPENTHTYIFRTKKRDNSLTNIGWENCLTNKNGKGVSIENGIYDYVVYDDYSGACHFTYKPDFFNMIDAYENGWITEYKSNTTPTCTIVVSLPGYDTITYHINFAKQELCLLSLEINNIPIDSFSSDVHDYWFDTEYNPDVVSYTLPAGVTATESFDDSTNVLMVRLALRDAIKTVEYKLHFRPVDGVDDFLGDHVSLYAMDKTICIDGATEPIYVYDLLGTFVGTGRGEEIRIPVAQAGVYVVRAGGKAVKVMVK